jgi:hypothetical protein
MIQKIFLFLLRKYSKSEEERIEIYKVLLDKTSDTYNEQTVFGNVYNAHIEFIMSSGLVKKLIKKQDLHSLQMIGSGLKSAYAQALMFLDTTDESYPISQLQAEMKKLPAIELEVKTTGVKYHQARVDDLEYKVTDYYNQIAKLKDERASAERYHFEQKNTIENLSNQVEFWKTKYTNSFIEVAEANKKAEIYRVEFLKKVQDEI